MFIPPWPRGRYNSLSCVTLSIIVLLYLFAYPLSAHAKKKNKLSTDDPLVNAALAVVIMKANGLVDYYIAPDGRASLVYVEPKVWQGFFHKDKVSFVNMFILFFRLHNREHPGPDEVSFSVVKDMSTKHDYACGYVKKWLAGSSGQIDIYK